MMYVYAVSACITDQLPNVTGIQNLPIDYVNHGGIGAIISMCNEVDKKPMPDELWRHEGVVENLMRDRCVLPVRYGTCIQSEKELKSFLEIGQESFLKDLDRLQGCIEVSVRVIKPEIHQQALSTGKAHRNGLKEQSGRAYLTNRLLHLRAECDEQRDLEAWADRIHKKLQYLSIDGKWLLHRHSLLVATGAYLVKRETLHSFQEHIGQLRSLYREYKFLCTGPWPPYSFVSPLELAIHH